MSLEDLEYVPTEAEVDAVVDAVVGVLEGLAVGLREMYPGRNPAGVPLSLEYVLAMLDEAARQAASAEWLVR